MKGIKKIHKGYKNILGRCETLCFSCRHSTNKFNACSWASRLEPVENWDAIKHDIIGQKMINRVMIDKKIESYFVVDCPVFERG